jgi:hypothetical protein
LLQFDSRLNATVVPPQEHFYYHLTTAKARMPILSASKADNWVDRGEPCEPVLARILAHYFDRRDPADASWNAEHAAAIRGLVEAGGTEVHVAAYLYRVLRELDKPAPPRGRITAIALWHAAKAALVRDFAERVLTGEVPRPVATSDSLSHWLAARLLTPDELEAFERGDDAEPLPYADGD